MALNDTVRFDRYVEVGSEYVTWVVYASPPYKMESKTWCYLFVGCAPYRGFFDQQDALEFANLLREDGFDTYVAGVRAYSTLGWFKDPILSSMLNSDRSSLASLIFHESAHGRIWIKGDVAFNESFASFVAEQGLAQWLDKFGSQGSKAQPLAPVSGKVDWTNLKDFLIVLRKELGFIYTSEKLTSDEVGAQKSQKISEWLACYEENKYQLGRGKYDGLVYQSLNNAFLMSLATYSDWVPSFRKIFEDSKGNWQRFFEEVEALGNLAKAERQNLLRSLAQHKVTGGSDYKSSTEIQC
jgi:predicted aminopeptidase